MSTPATTTPASSWGTPAPSAISSRIRSKSWWTPTSDGRCATSWRGCGCRPSCRRTAGRCGARSRPARALWTSTSPHGDKNASTKLPAASRPMASPPCSTRSSVTTEGSSHRLPERARVVIVGGGVIGVSTAYHLTLLGWTDVVLLEQGSLSGGTTWHAAGLVGQLRASESGTRLVQYSADLYSRLEEETGLGTGYVRCGGGTVARAPDRMTQLRRTAASAEAFGIDCTLLTPREAAERWPVMAVDDLVGAIWLPGDGKVNPTDLTMALARGARSRGARIVERTRVLDVLTAHGAVTGVRTDAGDIEAEVVVDCAGQWAAQVGAM